MVAMVTETGHQNRLKWEKNVVLSQKSGGLTGKLT